MTITGENLIGSGYSAKGRETYKGYNPVTNEELGEIFHDGSTEEVDRVMDLAMDAFHIYQAYPGSKRAEFLEAIADEIEALDDELIKRVQLETGLPTARLIGERGRTTGQIRMFAELLREGSWVEASIDLAQPERTPVPRQDLRRKLVALGPVVVFAASNFPLAFSIAGGDTASALAAGNPVVAKAHPSHPGTSELVGRAIIRAAQHTGMPEGVFSMIHGNSYTPGNALVIHPHTRAVGFTGSFQGGKALLDLAASRSEPIPVFAEMGSINPVFILDKALEKRSSALASQLADSVNLAVGQFCTKPGIFVVQENRELDTFLKSLSDAFSQKVPAAMLNTRFSKNYHRHISEIESRKEVQFLQRGQASDESSNAVPAIASVSAEDFLRNPSLHEEIFGPFALVIICRDKLQMLQLARQLKGQLTLTLMAESEEFADSGELISTLQQKAGRIIHNGVPTGVEVVPSMQHGGPFPATTDSRFTSVGTAAIKRFVRPVCFQNWPETLLPDELRNFNPMKINRIVNGKWTNEALK